METENPCCPLKVQQKYVRPVTVKGEASVSKVGKFIENDERFTISDIAKAVGIIAVAVALFKTYEIFLPDGYRIY